MCASAGPQILLHRACASPSSTGFMSCATKAFRHGHLKLDFAVPDLSRACCVPALLVGRLELWATDPEHPILITINMGIWFWY